MSVLVYLYFSSGAELRQKEQGQGQKHNVDRSRKREQQQQQQHHQLELKVKLATTINQPTNQPSEPTRHIFFCMLVSNTYFVIAKLKNKYSPTQLIQLTQLTQLTRPPTPSCPPRFVFSFHVDMEVKEGRKERRQAGRAKKKRVRNLDMYHLLHAPDSHDVILLSDVLFPSKKM